MYVDLAIYTVSFYVRLDALSYTMKITKDIARVFNILVVVLTPVLLLPLPFVVGTQVMFFFY